MLSKERTWGVLWVAATVSAAVPVAAAEPAGATAVLIAPLQGTASLRAAREAQVTDALGRAVESHGYTIATSERVLGHAVVACQSPECVRQTLDAAAAELAIVPAVWVQPEGGEELTLTLIRQQGKNLNVSGPIDDDVQATASRLVEDLLAQRAVVAGVSGHRSADASDPGRKHPHAWKAGPICLLAGGMAAFVAIGVGAATKGQQQQLDTTAVAIWSAVGAAAIVGGVTWWLVGAKRRRAATVALHPQGIDLRLRF